jgi:hypothetical protein
MSQSEYDDPAYLEEVERQWQNIPDPWRHPFEEFRPYGLSLETARILGREGIDAEVLAALKRAYEAGYVKALGDTIHT